MHAPPHPHLAGLILSSWSIVSNSHSLCSLWPVATRTQTTTTEVKFLVPDWGEIVDYGVGLSYWPAVAFVAWRRAGTYSHMPESTISPSPGQKIWLQNQVAENYSVLITSSQLIRAWIFHFLGRRNSYSPSLSVFPSRS